MVAVVESENAVIESKFSDTLPMKEFNVSNNLLGNRKALDEAYDRDGYLFFRGVINKDTIAKVREVYLKVLDDLAVIDPDIRDKAVYNGGPLDNYPITSISPPDLDPLLCEYPREVLTEDPQVKKLFEDIFGDEVFWVPNTEFHAVPPNSKSPKRFNYIHADGPNNRGLPLKVCWIPIAPIDEETGGLAVAEGLHKPRMNDFPRPLEGIGDDVVPDEAWRRTVYEPGDLLVFSLQAPHSGLANRSDKYFRLSMDIRGMKKSENIPAIGNVAAIDTNAITIDNDSGNKQTFRINSDTYCRIFRGKLSGMPLSLEEIPEKVKIGDPVYVAYDQQDTAIFIRPQH